MKICLSWGLDGPVSSLGTILHSPDIKSDCGRFINALGKGKSPVNKSDFLCTQGAKEDLNCGPNPHYF